MQNIPADNTEQYTHLLLEVQHTSSLPPSMYTVDVQQLLECLLQGGFRSSTQFFDCWKKHMLQQHTVVTVPWCGYVSWGNAYKTEKPDDYTDRFAEFAASLRLGFGQDMLPGHAKFVRFSVELHELIACYLCLINLPRKTCDKPLVAHSMCSTTTHTVENSHMLQLVVLVEDH